jgi:benzoyl-CoA reductase/2-hydroxyglutaryl-CoA dehydratase subunit BcrC/BadD/HgdB
VENMGFPVHWFELPLRKEKTADGAGRTRCERCEKWNLTPAGTGYHESAREFLVAQFRSLHRKLESTLGATLDAAALQASIRKVNGIRRQMKHIKQMVYSAPASVFPALEMMVLEFGNLHFYSDIDEWSSILAHVEETIEGRLTNGLRMADSGKRNTELRVIWVTPPADPLLLTYAEDQGLRVVGTEYVINQSLHEIRSPAIDCPSATTDDWLTALAETLLNASLIGSSRARAESAIQQAKEFGADGVIISGILGGSHCATETSLIRDYIQEQLDLPVLAFDVPAPTTGISSQIRTRMEAFIEVLRARRT